MSGLHLDRLCMSGVRCVSHRDTLLPDKLGVGVAFRDLGAEPVRGQGLSTTLWLGFSCPLTSFVIAPSELIVSARVRASSLLTGTSMWCKTPCPRSSTATAEESTINSSPELGAYMSGVTCLAFGDPSRLPPRKRHMLRSLLPSCGNGGGTAAWPANRVEAPALGPTGDAPPCFFPFRAFSIASSLPAARIPPRPAPARARLSALHCNCGKHDHGWICIGKYALLLQPWMSRRVRGEVRDPWRH